MFFKKRYHKYFISYCAVRDGGMFFGNADFTLEKPITCIEDIHGIHANMARILNITDPIILGWRKFDE